jgi:hypothetical protein
MGSSCVFRTLRAKGTVAAGALALCAASLAPADAVTYLPSQTFRAGTKIACVLDEYVNSATLKVGTDFKLRVVDTAHPALHGAEIHGFVTDVTQPAGTNRARIGFLLRSIHLRNGRTKPIRAYVVNRGVVQYNPAAQQAAHHQSPMMPMGTVTPGPIAWQMRFAGGPPSVGEKPNGAVGGYVYAAQGNEPIIVRAGTAVTVELANDLTIP